MLLWRVNPVFDGSVEFAGDVTDPTAVRPRAQRDGRGYRADDSRAADTIRCTPNSRSAGRFFITRLEGARPEQSGQARKSTAGHRVRAIARSLSV